MSEALTIGFGAALALLFAIGQLVLATQQSAKRENLLLAALLASVALWQGYSALFFAGKIGEWTHLAFLNTPAVFLSGPLLKDYYLRIVLRPDEMPGAHGRVWQRALPYTPFLLSLPLTAHFALIHPACKRLLLADVTQGCHNAIVSPHLLLAVAVFSLVIYLAIVVRRFFSVRVFFAQAESTAHSLTVYSLLVAAILLVSLASAVVCLAGIFSSDRLIRVSGVMVTATICGGYLTALAGSNWLRWFIVQAQKPKYARSKIAQISHDDVIGRLAQLMATEQLYRDENISLATLSQKVGLSPHQLSELLNEKLGRNFKTYVNELRITEARRMLSSGESANILHVGFAVGFNSKSAFNAAFRKLTGETPSNFLKKVRPGI